MFIANGSANEQRALKIWKRLSVNEFGPVKINTAKHCDKFYVTFEIINDSIVLNGNKM